ncbi:hypothetical protein CRE_14489 [Caenorhabditis remanei]|uniref:Uncharacterized protein n=1 Tax=Caenorhabditis remanei TaxID=31234 RepID=E3M969_CAERE|nr:hypothetical protein CRE_14489 [Caenorhabditis remanei]
MSKRPNSDDIMSDAKQVAIAIATQQLLSQARRANRQQQPRECFFCSSNNHKEDQCNQPNTKLYKFRKIQENNRCIICLGQKTGNHTIRTCRKLRYPENLCSNMECEQMVIVHNHSICLNDQLPQTAQPPPKQSKK